MVMRWFAAWLRARYAGQDPGYPPPRLRHLVPFRLLYWLDARIPDLCWTGVACWKLMGSEMGWFMDTRCWSGPPGREYDYCNKCRTQGEHDAAMALRSR